MGKDTVDTFLSYNSKDYKIVSQINTFLNEQGIATFFDRKDISIGLSWPEKLETTLKTVNSVVVFLGPHGLGSWQKREMYFSLDRQAQEDGKGNQFHVVPVLIPGAKIDDYGFISLNSWIDLRDDTFDENRISNLVKSIKYKPLKLEADVQTKSLICPYRGLSSFRERHSAFYFGREDETNKLYELTKECKLITVVGPSGSGKSSLAHAGLIPLIKKNRPPKTIWDCLSFTPGQSPFYNLAASLVPLLEPTLNETDRLLEAGKLANLLKSQQVTLNSVVDRVISISNGTEKLLLIVDQFEELFTIAENEDRLIFVDQLLMGIEKAPLTALLTLRADFYGQIISLSRTMSDLIEKGIVNITRLNTSELEQVIWGPANLLGFNLEEGLSDRIISDVRNQPGYLPLLEFALTELWVNKENNTLTHSYYEKIGKISGSITMKAESEFSFLTQMQQLKTRQIFSRLVRIAEVNDGEQDTRRRASIKDFTEEELAIIDRLVNARLLVTDRSTYDNDKFIEVAHEALILHWKRLGEWLNEDREFLLWRQRIRSDINEWNAKRSDYSLLLHGSKLFESQKWLQEHGGKLDFNEKEYIEKSIEDYERQQEELQRKRLNTLKTAFYLSLFFLVLSIATIFLWQETTNERTTRNAQRLAAVALSIADTHLDTSLLLAKEGVQKKYTTETISSLIFTLEHNPSLIKYVHAHDTSVQNVHFLGDQAISVDAKADIIYWNKDLSRIEASFGYPDSSDLVVSYSEISPDSMLMAIAIRGWIILWDIESQKSIASLPPKQSTGIESLVFSPDGHTLASIDVYNIVLWDLRSFDAIKILNHRSGNLGGALFLDSETLILSFANGSVQSFAIPSLKRSIAPITLDGWSQCLEVSPDKEILAICTRTGVSLYDIPGLNKLNSLQGQFPDNDIWSLAFSPNSKFLATGHANGNVLVWDLDWNEILGNPIENQGSISSKISFSADNKTLAIPNGELITLWDITKFSNIGTGVSTPEQLRSLDGAVSIDISSDGKWLAAAGDFLYSLSGSIVLWNLADTTYSIFPDYHDGTISSVAFSPNNNLLASAAKGSTSLMNFESSTQSDTTLGGFDYSIALWRVDSLKIDRRLSGHNSSVNQVIFNSDGSLLASAGCSNFETKYFNTSLDSFQTQFDSLQSTEYKQCISGRVIIWNILESDSSNYSLTGHNGDVTSIAFLANSNILASGGSDGKILLWDLATKSIKTSIIAHSKEVRQIVFDSQRELLISSSSDGTIKFWNAKDGKQNGGPIVARSIGRYGYPAEVAGISLNHDKSLLASAVENDIVLWDVNKRQQIGPPLSGHRGEVNSVSFVSDKDVLMSGSGLDMKIYNSTAQGIEGLTSLGDHRYLGHPVIFWDLEVNSLLNKALRIANRKLNDQEIDLYLNN